MFVCFSLYAPYVHLYCRFARIQAQDVEEIFASAEFSVQTPLGNHFKLLLWTLKHALLKKKNGLDRQKLIERTSIISSELI